MYKPADISFDLFLSTLNWGKWSEANHKQHLRRAPLWPRTDCMCDFLPCFWLWQHIYSKLADRSGRSALCKWRSFTGCLRVNCWISENWGDKSSLPQHLYAPGTQKVREKKNSNTIKQSFINQGGKQWANVVTFVSHYVFSFFFFHLFLF